MYIPCSCFLLSLSRGDYLPSLPLHSLSLHSRTGPRILSDLKYFKISTAPVSLKHMSRIMRKLTICIGKNKGADQLLNPKFPASSYLLCLYSSDCVGPVRKPQCWFSHDACSSYIQCPCLLSLFLSNCLSFSFSLHSRTSPQILY